MTKKIFDYVFALLLLVGTLPIFILIMLLITLCMGKPIFFKQLRPGFKQKLFRLYKFRTMNNSKDDKNQLLPDQQRLTKLGKFLRLTSLDELPQLFNILKGDMSFVGPRPLLLEYLELYTPEQKKRHDVKPGITGWAQINGRNAIEWSQKFSLDLWYVQHYSFWLDLKIILLTLLKVMRLSGINQSNEITMEKFKGANDCQSHKNY